MWSRVEPAMPWRSKHPRAASTIAARVLAASSFVLRIKVYWSYIRSGTYVYYTLPPYRRIPMSRKTAFAIASLLLVSACGKKDGASAQGAAPPPMPVTVVKVAQQKVPVTIEAVGQAEGSREVEIRARVSGILEKRLFDEGTPVPAGRTLFEIDAVPYELAVQQARAALQQERVKRELAVSEAKRLVPLAEEKAVAQRELDQATANV